MDAFIGMIMPFAGDYAPPGWAICNGQMLSIAQNQALFSIIGTTYGGSGTTQFAVPDLRGRAIVGPGQLTGGSNYNFGQHGGAESVTLNTNQLPAHSHTLEGVAAQGTTSGPAGVLMARAPNNIYAPASAGQAAPMGNTAISQTGGGQPVPTTTPYQCVTYIICTQGLYPTRP